MENVTSLIQQLSGNPLTTPIGQKIEQATDPSLPSEDWNLNMLICDMINDTDEGPRDAVRAIRRRLQNAGKNHTVVMYTLTVLETSVKNCGRRFHLLVTNKDFVQQELVKLMAPKNDPPLVLQQKVLSIIQTWADAFRGQPDLNGVVQVYNDLKSKSIEFPPSKYEHQVPIHTPQRSVRVQPPVNHFPLFQQAPPVNPNQLPTNPVQITQLSGNQPSIAIRMAGPIVLNEEQLTKLKSELDIVRGNINVFDEMLSELDKSKQTAGLTALQNQDLELLHELNATCHQMQKRIVELLDRVSNEEITIDLLTINDNLNSLFTRYSSYATPRRMTTNTTNSNLEASLANSPPPPPPSTAAMAAAVIKPPPSKAIDQQDEAISLIDLGETNASSNRLTSQLEGLSIANKISPNKPRSQQSGDQDFDEFAQLRSTEKPRMIDGVELPNEQEAKEMEHWLKEQNGAAEPASPQRKSEPKKPASGDLLDL